jgi:hypothetical protein
MKLFKAFLLIIVVAVVVVAQDGVKTSYGILIDNTGSMRTQLELERQLAREILKEVGDAPVTVFGFVTTGRAASAAYGLECVVDRDRLVNQIDKFETVPGQTTLRDALHETSGRLKNLATAPCPQAEEKILVVLTDGDDRSSSLGTEDLFKNLKASGVRIYIIALVEELKPREGFIFKSSLGKSKDFLKRVASETNGRIVFPKKKEKAEDVVERLFSANYKADK